MSLQSTCTIHVTSSGNLQGYGDNGTWIKFNGYRVPKHEILSVLNVDFPRLPAQALFKSITAKVDITSTASLFEDPSTDVDFLQNSYDSYGEPDYLHVDFPELPRTLSLASRATIETSSVAWLRAHRYDVPPLVFDVVGGDCTDYVPHDLSVDILLCPQSDYFTCASKFLTTGPLGQEINLLSYTIITSYDQTTGPLSSNVMSGVLTRINDARFKSTGPLSETLNAVFGNLNAQIIVPGPLGNNVLLRSVRVSQARYIASTGPLGNTLSILACNQDILTSLSGPLGENTQVNATRVGEVRNASILGPLGNDLSAFSWQVTYSLNSTDGPLGQPTAVASRVDVSYEDTTGPLGNDLSALVQAFEINFTQSLIGGPLGNDLSSVAKQNNVIFEISTGPLGELVSVLTRVRPDHYSIDPIVLDECTSGGYTPPALSVDIVLCSGFGYTVDYSSEGPLGQPAALSSRICKVEYSTTTPLGSVVSQLISNQYSFSNATGPLGNTLQGFLFRVPYARPRTSGPLGNTIQIFSEITGGIQAISTGPLGEYQAAFITNQYSYADSTGPLGVISTLSSNYSIVVKSTGPLGNQIGGYFDIRLRARVELAGPLASAIDLLLYNNQIRISEKGPLGQPAINLEGSRKANVLLKGPLGNNVSIVTYTELVDFWVQGPLGELSPFVYKKPTVNVRMPGVLSTPSAQLFRLPQARIQEPGPLGQTVKGAFINQFLIANSVGPLGNTLKIQTLSPNTIVAKALGPLGDTRPKAVLETPELILVKSKVSGPLGQMSSYIGLRANVSFDCLGPLSQSSVKAYFKKNDLNFESRYGEFFFFKLYKPSEDNSLPDEVEAYFFDDFLLENEYIEPGETDQMIIALDHEPYAHKLKVCYTGGYIFKFEFVSGDLPVGLTLSEDGCITGVIKELDTMEYNLGLPSSALWYYFDPLGDFQAYSRVFRFRVRVNTVKGTKLIEKDFHIRVVNNWSCDTAKMLRNIDGLNVGAIAENTDGFFKPTYTQPPAVTIDAETGLCEPCIPVEKVTDLPVVIYGPVVVPSDTKNPDIEEDIRNLKFKVNVDLEVEIIFRHGETMELEFNHEGR